MPWQEIYILAYTQWYFPPAILGIYPTGNPHFEGKSLISQRSCLFKVLPELECRDDKTNTKEVVHGKHCLRTYKPAKLIDQF